MQPVVTIVIATFNSEKTLPKVLKAIRSQTYPSNKVELLAVDGGSKDTTLKIARKFGCRIINNPRTEPLYARYLGYIKARGKYLMYIDHDEVLRNKMSIQKKIDAMSSDSRVHLVVFSGYQSPRGLPFINNYINEFGDPFSFFVYGTSKNSRYFIQTLKTSSRILFQNKDYVVFDFSNAETLPFIELGTAGCLIDLDYFKKNFPQVNTKYYLIPLLFYLIAKKFPYLAVTKNDPLIHYSADTLKIYFNKIRWRVKNNIYHISSIGVSGFAGREKYYPFWMRLKKYLFIPYSYSLVLPLLDSFYLIITRKSLFYLVHVPLCFYTATLIVFHRLLKLFGFRPPLRSYDESKIVKKS